MGDMVKCVEIVLEIRRNGPYTFQPIGHSDHMACSLCGIMGTSTPALSDPRKHKPTCLYVLAIEATT